jgi:hypothetical protein
MSDVTDDYESIEARLSAYGSALQGHLDGEQDDGAKGTLLVGGFGAHNAPAPDRQKPTAAVLSVAAALLLVVSLLVPSVLGDDPAEPITVNGGDLASAPQTDGAADADGPQAGDDFANADEKNISEQDGDAEDKASDDKADGDDLDWSSFSVAVDGPEDGDHDFAQDNDDAASDDDKSVGSAAASADGSSEADEADEQEASDCPQGKELRADSCVVIGAPPTNSASGCPTGALVVAQQCYEIVPPSCGELQGAPDGTGCLKLVGAAGAQGGCPDNYELDGGTCVKLVAAPVSCSQGTPSGDSCVIKQSPTGGEGGCASGQTQFGNGCYELSSPATNCDGLAMLADGNCRLPVDGEQSTECPAGLQPWDNVCYRYEDPPVYDCAGGESDGAGWCQTTEDATPGPDVCDEGVLQDAQGCYVLVEADGEGNCGELPEFEGMCRKAKPSYQTWTCSDGETVYEPTCKVWTEAISVTCLAGEPVENNTKCKTIEDPITAEGCPSYAFEDNQGCYKSKEPQFGCGELPKTPDGQQCKTWVSNPESDASCADGFELVGEYCKRYVDGTPGTCSGSELVTVNGTTKCKYSTSPSEPTTGCAPGAIERSGECYVIVAASCDDFDADLYGQGCKKPIDVEASLICEAGFNLVANECIKKN